MGGTGSWLLVMTLDLIPLVGRTVLRGLFKGGCVLRMSVGRPTADDWVCLSTLFVVWPEVFQHWSLQAVGLGHILLRKYWPPGGFMPTGNPQNIPPVSLSLQWATTAPASAGHPPVPAGGSGPGSYEAVTSSPGSWCAWDSVCSLEEWNFCFPQSCRIPAIKPHQPSKPNALGDSPSFTRPFMLRFLMWNSTFTPVGQPLPYNYCPFYA